MMGRSLRRSFCATLLAGFVLFFPTLLAAQTATISGTITAGGNPVEGAEVIAEDEELDQKFKAESDTSGTYTITDVLPGKYIVSVYDEDFEYAEYPDTVVVGPGDNITGVDFVLEAQGEEPTGNGFLAGTVTLSTGEPVEGAEIEAFGLNTGEDFEAETEADGTYMIDGLPQDNYVVKLEFEREVGGELDEVKVEIFYPDVMDVALAEEIFVSDTGSVIGIDFVVPQLTLYTVTFQGTVTDEATGAPIAGGSVEVEQADVDSLISGGEDKEVMTDSSGTYSMQILFLGPEVVGGPTSYVAKAEAEGYEEEFYDDKPSIFEADVITVSGDTTVTLDFALAPEVDTPNSISGTVTDTSGTPIPDAVITVSNLSGTFEEHEDTEADGSYLIDDLPEDSYYVRAVADGFLFAYYDGVQDPAFATPVVASGAVTGIDFILSADPDSSIGSIEGDVEEDTSGGGLRKGSSAQQVIPAPGVVVYAVDPQGSIHAYDVTDVFGRFKITGLSSSDYTVTTTKPGLTSASQSAPLSLGFSPVVSGVSLTVRSTVTGVEQPGVNGTVPESFRLYQNFPNPFNPETMIRYELPHAGFVSLSVYDILGRKIATLVDGYQVAARYSVRFNPSGLASGLYFYRLQARQINGDQTDNFVETKKMVLSK